MNLQRILARLAAAILLAMRLTLGPVAVLGDEPQPAPTAPAVDEAPPAIEPVASEGTETPQPPSIPPAVDSQEPPAEAITEPSAGSSEVVVVAAPPAPVANDPTVAPSPPATEPSDAPAPAADTVPLADSPVPATSDAAPAVAQDVTFNPSMLANAAAPFAVAITLDHADGVYRQGERLAVEFASERPAHLYVLYHQADGVTKLLFPNQASPESRVGDQPLIVAATGGAFRFRIAAPLGSETLQVLAAPQPIAELEAIDHTAGPAPAVSPAVLANVAARVQADPSFWAERHVDLQTNPGVGLGGAK